MANKVKFGLRNLHYAIATDDGTGTLTYGTPVRWPGAVNIALDVEGSSDPFYADDIIYFISQNSNGYSGTLEVALVPDEVRTDVFGETADTAGMIVERVTDTPKEIALLFEFQGDQNATKHCLYRCMLGKPGVNGQTMEGSKTPQAESLNITAMPRINDYVVKAKCPSTSANYATFYSEVKEPNFNA